MKTKKDRKPKPTLKVKKESAGESSLKKAVKNVKAVLKKDTKQKTPLIKKETKPVLKRLAKKEKKEKKDTKEVKPLKIKKLKEKAKEFIKIKTLKGDKSKEAKGKKESKIPETGRGVIYIGHIPHGFYEEQMKSFFAQFGKVTRVRVSRSKITGRSKGYGYVEFLHPEVAKIAAESMNNYLMSGRLVKTEYIPPEKQHEHYFKGENWKVGGHPKLKKRMKAIRLVNSTKPNSEHKTFVKGAVKKLAKLSQLLKKEGIDLKMKLGEVEI